MTSDEMDEVLLHLLQDLIGHPLTQDEFIQLRQLLLSLLNGGPPASGVDPAKRQQAEQIAGNARNRKLEAIQKVAEGLRDASERSQRAQHDAEQAALKTIAAASSLSELRPCHLRPGQGGGNQMVIAQIADRLANLVQSEVRQCFEKQFGVIHQQMQHALTVLNDANARWTSAAEKQETENLPAAADESP